MRQDRYAFLNSSLRFSATSTTAGSSLVRGKASCTGDFSRHICHPTLDFQLTTNIFAHLNDTVKMILGAKNRSSSSVSSRRTRDGRLIKISLTGATRGAWLNMSGRRPFPRLLVGLSNVSGRLPRTSPGTHVLQPAAEHKACAHCKGIHRCATPPTKR